MTFLQTSVLGSFSVVFLISFCLMQAMASQGPDCHLLSFILVVL